MQRYFYRMLVSIWADNFTKFIGYGWGERDEEYTIKLANYDDIYLKFWGQKINKFNLNIITPSETVSLWELCLGKFTAKRTKDHLWKKC